MDSSEAGADHPAHIVVERGGRVKRVNTAVVRSINHVFEVTEIAGGIALGSDGAALAIEAGLSAEGGVFEELLGAVVGVDLEGEAGMA